MTLTRLMIAAAAGLVCTIGCSDATASSSDQPSSNDKPGTATVSLMSNNQDDGAISLTIHGPGLSSATALDSRLTVFSRLASPTELKVIVLGDSVGPGALFTLPVGASNRPEAYTVSIDQVAMPSDSLRPDVSRYQAPLAASTN